MMQVKSGQEFNIGAIGARISNLAMTFPNFAATAIEAFGQQEAKRCKSRTYFGTTRQSRKNRAGQSAALPRLS